MSESPALRVIAAIVIIIILILGAWGIIIVFTQAPSFISELTTRNSSTSSSTRTTATSTVVSIAGGTLQNQKISVELPSGTLQSGTPFVLSWTDVSGGHYSYIISYTCTSGITFDAPVPTGSYVPVPCNTPFNYTNAQSSITLVPHVTGSQNISSQFTVSAVDLGSGGTIASGSAVAVITPAAQMVSAGTYSNPTPQTSVSYPPQKAATKGYYSNPYGIPDLSVQILYVHGGTAQFKIMNAGTKTAPPGWIFTASLPLSGGYTYTSPPQQSIAPGGYIINMLNWESQNQYYQNPCPTYQTYQYSYPNYYPQNCGQYNYSGYPYGGAFSVTVDPYGMIPDLNRYNNTASMQVY